MRTFLAAVISVATFFAAARMSYAYTYSVSGRVEYLHVLGNYCSTSTSPAMDCSGSLYPATEFNQIRGIKDSLIVLQDELGNHIGFGSSDSSGYFSVNWTRSTLPSQIWVLRWFAHKDTRFWLADNDGASWYHVVTVINNPGASNWDIGGWWWNYDDTLNNGYAGMLANWDNSLKNSSDMLLRYSEMRLRIPANLPTSECFPGIVCLPGNRSKNLLALAHEVGHTVFTIQTKVVVSPYGRYSCGVFNYPNECVGPGTPASCYDSGIHDPSTSEHFCSTWEEGLANFLALPAIYTYSAAGPMYCAGFGTCHLGYNIATSPGSSCTPNQQHLEGNVTRYLWDTYDTVADPGWTDSVPANASTRLNAIINTLDSYPAGTGSGQVNEPYNAALTEIDDKNGRSALDWKNISDSVENTSAQFTNNCSPGS
jgi:hypothetical protein